MSTIREKNSTNCHDCVCITLHRAAAASFCHRAHISRTNRKRESLPVAVYTVHIVCSSNRYVILSIS